MEPGVAEYAILATTLGAAVVGLFVGFSGSLAFLAGSLAAYYSKNRDSQKVEIDYIQKKNVKKPAGAKPGFVVYYTNYSLVAEPAEHAELLVND